MYTAHVEVAILAHQHLWRHTRLSSSAIDDEHAGHDREVCPTAAREAFGRLTANCVAPDPLQTPYLEGSLSDPASG
jgi:hypothetical protein